MRFLIPLLIFLFAFSKQEGNFSSSKTSSPDSTKTSTDSILDFWLSKQAVENNKPLFKSLWLFVSVKELDSIEESHQFLRTFNYSTKSQKDYYSMLNNSKFDKQAIANILRSSDKLRIRDAWNSYWPLINEDQGYRLQDGNQLIQVFLEDSSLVVQFQPQEKNPFIVYDVNGDIISVAEAIQREKHIAVIFMNYSKKETLHDEYGAPVKTAFFHHRSFYLVNEKMIKHWQHATPSMQDGILKDLKYLLLLEAWVKESPEHIGKSGKAGKHILRAWNDAPKNRSIAEKIFACRRSTLPYDFNNLDMQKTINSLRAIWPLQVKTMEKFPSKGIR